MRAEVETRLERFDDAEQNWQRALALATKEQAAPLRVGWANTIVRRGDHVRAVATAETATAKTATADGAGDPLATFLLARVYALAAASASKNSTTVAEADRVKLVEAYGATAIEVLVRAERQGAFARAARVEELESNADWAAVRSRPQFAALVTRLRGELAAAAKGPAKPPAATPTGAAVAPAAEPSATEPSDDERR
jgi:hypothetical protein